MSPNNSQHEHGMGMMWVMMIGCALPLIFTVFAGSAKGWTPMFAVAGLAAMFGLHFWMMRRHHHARHDDLLPPKKMDNQNSDSSTQSRHYEQPTKQP